MSEAGFKELFGPAGRGLPVDVGEAGKMLRVFVVRVPAGPQRRVHVSRGGVTGRVQRWAGVTAVSGGHIWPAGGDRRGVQPRCAAHQAGVHSRHLAVELVLQGRKKSSLTVTLTNNLPLIIRSDTS